MTLSDANTSSIRTLFRRHECKYLVSEALATEIRAWTRPYVALDQHAAVSPDQSYDIASLYLDSPDLRLFQESEEGILNRIKLRIRTYDDAADSLVFPEIKRRFNSLVLKGRACLERGTMASILSGGVPDADFLPEDQQACYQEFVGWIARWLAGPVVWVKYRREAWVGIFNRDVRITMDRNLVCAPAEGGLGLPHASSWRPVETRQVVLEVKFDESCPDWVSCLVQRFHLERRSFSKYGRSVKYGMGPSSIYSARSWEASS